MKIFGLRIMRETEYAKEQKNCKDIYEILIDERNALRRENARLREIEAKYKRLTDHDPATGRFVKNE